MNILLAITFVFGPLVLLINLVMFMRDTSKDKLGTISTCLLAVDGWDAGAAKGFAILLGGWFYWFSLIFQVWFWLFRNNC